LVRPTRTNQAANEKINLTIETVYSKSLYQTPEGIFYKSYDNFVYFVNDQYYIRFYADKNDLKRDDSYYYEHNLGRNPFQLNGGILTTDQNENVYYESFLSDSLPYANLAIKCFYDKESLRIMHAHPITIVKEMPCSNSNCHGGYIKNGKEIGGIRQMCMTCNGKGKISVFNIGATITRRANDNIDTDPDTNPIIEYISPPLDSAQFQQTSFRDALNDLESHLELNTIDEAQSGVAKTIDERQRQISVYDIAKDIYSNIEYICQAIADLSFINDEKTITISYPTSFSFKTDEDYLNNITTFKASGINGASIISAELEYIYNKFSTKPTEKRKAEIALLYDATVQLGTDELLQYFTMNVYDMEALKIRALLPNVLTNMALENDFLQLSNDQVIAKLDAIFKPTKPIDLNLNTNEKDNRGNTDGVDNRLDDSTIDGEPNEPNTEYGAGNLLPQSGDIIGEQQPN
jgi:hypothetical protein